MCGNGKLPKLMGKPAGALLFGDFPGPCFLTCTKPLALSSRNPVTLPTFYSLSSHVACLNWQRCHGMEKVSNLRAKAIECSLCGRMRGPRNLVL